ncbi:hypothetical protein CPB85DRAFT_1256467 [Mucidula mucida]|nr:hypothetical protein CPB85DRAFT_1256467 [Mucidula mucida]
MAKRAASPRASGSRKKARTARKTLQVVPPGPTRKLVPIDFENTIRVVVNAIDQAGEMDGRESAYYEPFNETFAYFARSPKNAGNNKDKITVAPQFSFRREVRAAAAGPSTRHDRVNTRAHAAANNIDIPDVPMGAEDNAPDEPILPSTIPRSEEDRPAHSEKPKDAWSTPDITLFKNHFEWNEDTQSYDTTRVPFCIIEAKPPRINLSTTTLGPMSSQRAITLANAVINGTRTQMGNQVKAVFHEYQDPEDVPFLFVFVFSGKYFSFHRLEHGAEGLPPVRSRQQPISSFLNDDETDFSPRFYDCWKEMMGNYDIEMLNGYLRE